MSQYLRDDVGQTDELLAVADRSELAPVDDGVDAGQWSQITEGAD
jgi:hypothetical protein